MKNNSLLIKAWALAVSSVVMVSCEVMDDYTHVDSNVIKFGVDADADGAPSTRATQYADSPVVMLGEGGSDTLYLHASIDVNTATVSKEAKAGTRGVPINSGNFQTECKNFGVTAYTQGDGKLFMSDEEVSNYANEAWSPSGGVRYWPEDETLDFYAYAPYSFNKNKPLEGALTIDKTDHTMSFSYTVPTTTDGNDAVAQPDIMFAYAACSRSTTNERGNVPLEFAHALAAVKFVANDIAGCTINHITLKGLYGAGECTFTPAGEEGAGVDKPSGTFAWTYSGEQNKDFTQTFDVPLNDQQTGEQDITDKKPETTFMMIPQQLEGATVEVELTTNDGKRQEVEGKLASGNLTEWEAGKIYTYKISTESINWTYVFEVTPTISFDLGVTSGKYQVKSYRYRTQNESVKEAVPWEVTGVTATDKPITSAEKPLSNPKDYVTEFTYNGDGTNNGQWQDYDIGVAKTVMHTTCPADQTLKETPTKGSPESPCDLSTEGGGRMTTANCYVVNAAGTYKLPLVYGNAYVNGSPNSQAYNDSHFVDYNNKPIIDPWIRSSGTPKDATLVWSDGFYMFTDVHLKGDYLVFTINKEYLQQANAIVAVLDDKGTIMWSWHIWVTERDINQTHEVEDYKDSSKKYQMMSSNLGWVDGKQVYYDLRELKFTFTQTKTNDVKIMTVTQEGATFDYKDAGSTYYQWGRKDPIVALMNRDKTGVNDYRRLDVPTNDYLYKTNDDGLVTCAEGIKHPNVYYVKSTHATAWLTDAAYSPKLWNIDGTEKDVWVENSRKTVYDPSPKGFKVPVPRAFSVFVDGGAISDNVCGTLNGYIEPAPNNYQYHVYPKKNEGGEPIPFTATGQRSNQQKLGSGPGSLWAMYGVYYWTNAAQSNGTSYSFVIRREDEVNQDGSITKIASYTIGFLGTQTMARPVRCMRE